jgi:hypothetical protein
MYKNHCIKISIISLLLFVSTTSYSQSTDLLRIETTHVPENDNGIETTRYRFLVNVPIKLEEDKYLVTGTEFNRFDFETSREYPFDSSELNRLYVIDLNLGYITKWNDAWRLITLVTPRLASNFTGKILAEDMRLNLTATLLKDVKDVEKPFRLALGLAYNSNAGLPFPLPLVSYYKRFHPNWSYTLGIPRMNFKYHISKKHTLQTALLLDGYYINIQNDIVLPDGELGSNISLSALVGAFGYKYNITKYISLYGLFGYTLTQNGVLRDDRRNEVFLLNNEGNMYFRGGFKIGIF